jgi:hypothetical protein
MCYGNSIINTCPHCTIVDQTFEFHGCHSGSNPTDTWWILPSAILEDVWLEDPCDSCSHLYGWLEELPSSTSDYSLTESDSADEESAEQDDDADEHFMASVSTDQPWDEDPEEHLNMVCTWYEDVERYLNSIKASIPSMCARCVATRDVTLITRLGLLEANIQMTLTDAAEKLEHYIEVSTWLRQCTTDENRLRDTEPEEVRAAMFEMRLIFIECESEEACSDAVTERLGNSATELWYAMEAAEEEIGKEAGLSCNTEKVNNRKSFVGRVLSIIAP